MDKSGERMVLAYIIGKYEEERGAEIDWHWMMYASLFGLLKKIALCDIKAPVQRMIKSEYPEEYSEYKAFMSKSAVSVDKIEEGKIKGMYRNKEL